MKPADVLVEKVLAPPDDLLRRIDALLADDDERQCPYNRRMLTAVVEAIENYVGCDTPFEEFITRLLGHESIRPVTPDDVENELEVFRANFKDMAEAAPKFVKRYPGVLTAPLTDAGNVDPEP